jgi:geranylgeranyl diphosphate synthase, type I
MAADPALLGLIRARVAAALDEFLTAKRAVLAGISDDLLPWLEVTGGLLAGGKRLRPAFCYWGWRAAGGGDDPAIFTAAAALELLHASALVHDDVMDASDTRRGQPAVHRQFAARYEAAVSRGAARHEAAGSRGAARTRGAADSFGTGAAILIGDALLAWTDELYHASGLPAAALRRGQPVLNAMRTEVAAGQYLDLLNQFSRAESTSSALRVVTYKTARYTIERPMQLGAALAGPDSAVASTCTEYGLPLGIAFQLRDDILGVFGDPAQTGKPVTGDLREGKQTVLIALARERATPAQARLLDRHLGDRNLTDQEAAKVREVLTGTGALAECEALIGASVKEATAALDGAPITAEAKTALTELAVHATARAD